LDNLDRRVYKIAAVLFSLFGGTFLFSPVQKKFWVQQNKALQFTSFFANLIAILFFSLFFFINFIIKLSGLFILPPGSKEMTERGKVEEERRVPLGVLLDRKL
jgi:hypothetical protein